MGWCYTFGVDCSSGCKHPMFVRETLDACTCEVCGVVCEGRFASCWRSVFQGDGMSLQMRSLPHSVPYPLDPTPETGAALDDPLRETVAPMPSESPYTVAGSGSSGGAGAGAGAGRNGSGGNGNGNGSRAGTDGNGDGSHSSDTAGEVREAEVTIARALESIGTLQDQIADLKTEIGHLSAGVDEIAARDGRVRLDLERLAAELRTLIARPVAPVRRAPGEPPAMQARPGRAVVHAESLPLSATPPRPIVANPSDE